MLCLSNSVKVHAVSNTIRLLYFCESIGNKMSSHMFQEEIDSLTQHIRRRHLTWNGLFNKIKETSVYNSNCVSEFSDIDGSDFKGDDFDESSLDRNATHVDTNLIELQPNCLQPQACDESTTDLDELSNVDKLGKVLKELQNVSYKENIDPGNVKALSKKKFTTRIKKNRTKLSSYKNVRGKWRARFSKFVKKLQFSHHANANTSDVTSVAPQHGLPKGNIEFKNNSSEKLKNLCIRLSMTSTHEERNDCFNTNCELTTSSLLNKDCQIFDKSSKDVCFRDISNLMNSNPLATNNLKKSTRNQYNCKDLTMKFHNELNFELNSNTSVISAKNKEQKKIKNSTLKSKISSAHGSNLNTTSTLKSTQIFNNGIISEVYSEEYLKIHNITDGLDVDFDPYFDSNKNLNYNSLNLSYPKTNPITYLEDVLETSRQNDYNLNSTSGNTCAPNRIPIINLEDVLSTNWQNEYNLRPNPNASLPLRKNIVLNKMNTNKADKNKNTLELHTNDNLSNYSQNINTIGTVDNSYLFASLPWSDSQLVLEKYKDKIEELYSEEYMRQHNITDVLDIDAEMEISQMILQDAIHDELQVTNCSSNIHFESTVYEKDTDISILNSSSIEVTNNNNINKVSQNTDKHTKFNNNSYSNMCYFGEGATLIENSNVRDFDTSDFDGISSYFNKKCSEATECNKSRSDESESCASLPGAAEPDTREPSTTDASDFNARSGAIYSSPSTKKVSERECQRNERKMSYSYNTRASTAGQCNNVLMVTDVNANNINSPAEMSSDISKQHSQVKQCSVVVRKLEFTKSDTK